MRTLACLAALALFTTGCPNPPPFDVTITNTGAVTTYLNAGDSSGVLMRMEQEIGGTWRPLSRSLAFMCMERCGVPGQVVCADVAAELLVPHALLPGDSTVKSFDGEFWYEADAGCAMRANLTGPMRATLWHDDVVIDTNTGDEVAEPTASGPMSNSGELALQEATEESFEFDLTGRSTIVFEIAE